MAWKWPVALTASAILASSGCVNEEASPDRIEAPIWTVGDSWLFNVSQTPARGTGETEWQNGTVKFAVEKKGTMPGADETVYFVHIEVQKDGSRSFLGLRGWGDTIYLDTDSLNHLYSAPGGLVDSDNRLDFPIWNGKEWKFSCCGDTRNSERVVVAGPGFESDLWAISYVPFALPGEHSLWTYDVRESFFSSVYFYGDNGALREKWTLA
jgi:hypothetical protein